MKYVIDAYAWIEYFEGTEKGLQVAKIIEHPETISITNTVTIAEIAHKFTKENKEFRKARDIIQSLSQIQPVHLEFAEETGRLHAKLKEKIKHLSLADSFVIQTAEMFKAKIITGDQEFKQLKNVVFLT